MLITKNTTVREVIESCPDAKEIFLKHDVDVDLQCPDAVLDFPIQDCESMCHVDDIDLLVVELQKFVDSKK